MSKLVIDVSDTNDGRLCVQIQFEGNAVEATAMAAAGLTNLCKRVQQSVKVAKAENSLEVIYAITKARLEREGAEIIGEAV